MYHSNIGHFHSYNVEYLNTLEFEPELKNTSQYNQTFLMSLQMGNLSRLIPRWQHNKPGPCATRQCDVTAVGDAFGAMMFCLW